MCVCVRVCVCVCVRVLNIVLGFIVSTHSFHLVHCYAGRLFHSVYIRETAFDSVGSVETSGAYSMNFFRRRFSGPSLTFINTRNLRTLE